MFRNKNLWFPILLIAAICLYWWRVTLLGLTPAIRDPGHLNEDFFSMFPAWKLIFSMIREGHLPLWSPCVSGGMLLLADQHYTIAYPPIWVNLFFSPAVSFALVMMLHYAVAAVSLYFLMKRLGIAPIAAFFSSCVYVFSFPVTYGFLLYGGFWAWHLLPLLLFLAVCYLDEGRRGSCLFLALVWQMQMCTFIQSSYNISILFAAFVLHYALAVVRRRLGWPVACRRLAGIGAGVALGTCLAAVHLIPLFEFSSLWQYRPFSFEQAAAMSLPPRMALELLFSARKFHQGWWALVSYVGAAGVVFAVCAAAREWRNSTVRFFAAVFAVAYVLALGSVTPLYRLFFTWFPGAHYFHHPMRFLWAVPLCLSVLAGFGVNRVVCRAREGNKGGDLALCACLAALCAVLYAGKRYHFPWIEGVPLSSVAVRQTAPYYFTALVLGIAALSGRCRGNLAAAALACLVVFESYQNAGSIEYFDAGSKYAVPDTVRFLKREAGLHRFVTYNQRVHDYPPRFMDADSVPLIYPELSNYFQLYDIQCRGPLHIRRYDSLMKALGRGYEFVLDLVAYNPRVRDLGSPVLDLFGVKYVVSKGELDVPRRMLYDLFGETSARRGAPVVISAREQITADQIVIKSYLEGAADAVQGQAVALLSFWRDGRRVAEAPLVAGVHTSEVFDLNDAQRRGAVKHGKADAWETWKEWTDEGHAMTGAFYRGIVDLGREVSFDRMDVHYLPDGGCLTFTQILYRPGGWRKTLDDMRRRFRPVFRDPSRDIVIYVNTDALPRAFLVGEVEVARSGEEALERLLDGSVHLSERVILEEDPPPWFVRAHGAAPFAGEAEITRYSPNRIEFESRANAPSFLFVSDIHYPGWETLVDGAPAKTYLADYAFRAVPLPPGGHRVVMRFRPWSVALGAGVSLVAALILVAGIIAESVRGARRLRSCGQRRPRSTTIRPSSLM
jgi:hypothetical protein